MTITWKRYGTPIVYTGTMDGTDDYYAVSKRGTRWECWIAGQYLGRFPTMREAKAEALRHAAA